MRTIAEVLVNQNNSRMGFTSEHCLQHEISVNGETYIKKIALVSHDGEEFCPLCERERTTRELSELENAKIKEAMNKRNYNTFANRSLLTDIGLLDASFTNYNGDEKEVIANKERATTAFKQYRDGKVFNTFLQGVPGSGKSHLAMSILRNLNESGEKDKSCLFVSVDEMLFRIRDSFENKESRYTESYIVDLLSKVDYLVLDDLGAETGGTGTQKQASDFTLRILYAVANGRQNKPTIITSNLSGQDLTRMYDPKLISRLLRDTYLIKFEHATDKRIKNIEF